MTLLSAGYWHTTFWAENYWNPNYWLKYSVVAPTGDGGLLDFYWRKKRKDQEEELFIMVKELLEAFA